MAHSFLVFDFGVDEDAAQKARHQLDGWRQAFRLDKKLQVKFERQQAEPSPKSAEETAAPPKATKAGASAKSKAGAKTKSKAAAEDEAGTKAGDSQPSKIRLIVRLDFSDHEKLSRQRWMERIPADEHFKAAHPQVIRAGEAEFQSTSDLFDSLD